ncbi:unnamed protein product, partial [Brenthis ino]
MNKAEEPDKIVGGIKILEKNDKFYSIIYKTGEIGRLHILNDHVFRYYMSPSGKFNEYPEPNNPQDVAKIVIKNLDDYGYTAFQLSLLIDLNTHYIVQTKDLQIVFDKILGTLKVYDIKTDKDVLHEATPLSYADRKSVQRIHQKTKEYFFGGGMQNGRFSHKGEIIKIVNCNNWGDGGVTSPCPFYWSSFGYGVLRNTWQPGIYDFGVKSIDFIETIHKGEDFDAYFFINAHPKDILKDYYELTGQPLLMPEYAYYEAHLNAFNRDYWVKVASNVSGAILFEDGKYYKSYKPNEIGIKKGILESLNGEKNNYQFSARAMIDRYIKHDIPLGWFIPNDGYGSGYGQTDSLDGDIQNLKEFVSYAMGKGIKVALWTESNLTPADPLHPKKGERDLNKEVGIANVVALKCDVAWIGSGYSFGLNAIEQATKIFEKAAKNKARNLIIMVDGWAGTQRYSGIWSGDQKGGEWEYIRFHIPTYIGASLSGQPVIGSDMDGIYAGGCKEINIRDYQWKTFTPLQLNMDGWGNTPKTPFSYDDEATKINRAYLKLKSMLLPYNYSIGYESINGLPMVRAMFLEFPEEFEAYTKDSQYQYMWGPNILVSPIYNDVKVDGNSIRDGIYLPDKNQVWIDFITGKKYQGGKIYNNIITPLWKIPVFIKDGSIIPMTNPNNNPHEVKRDLRIFTLYPNGTSSFVAYEDDGITSDYLKGSFATTKILAQGPKSNTTDDLLITIYKTHNSYETIVKERTTLLQIMASTNVENIKVDVNGEPLALREADNLDDFKTHQNVFYFNKEFALNPYLEEHRDTKQKFLLIKIEKMDVTMSEIKIKLKKFVNTGEVFGNLKLDKHIKIPSKFNVNEEKSTCSSITLDWNETGANFYEIERDGVIFSNIIGNTITFKDFVSESKHDFRIRSVLGTFVSEWSSVLSGFVLKGPLENNIIKNIIVKCNFPCQPCQEVSNLTERNKLIWHTNWGSSGKANPRDKKYIHLKFDLGAIHEVDRAIYLPCDDVGNGTILKLKYRSSIDGTKWTSLSHIIEFEANNSSKVIVFNGIKMRFLDLIVLKSIGNFGSGKQMMFLKK